MTTITSNRTMKRPDGGSGNKRALKSHAMWRIAIVLATVLLFIGGCDRGHKFVIRNDTDYPIRLIEKGAEWRVLLAGEEVETQVLYIHSEPRIDFDARDPAGRVVRVTLTTSDVAKHAWMINIRAEDFESGRLDSLGRE